MIRLSLTTVILCFSMLATAQQFATHENHLTARLNKSNTGSESGVATTIKGALILEGLSNPVKLGGTINSADPENGPIISPDGTQIYFSRSYHAKNVGGAEDEEDIWFANWNSTLNQWDDPQNMGAKFNNEGPNFINSFTIENGIRTIILGNAYTGKKKSKMMSGLSYSKWVDGEWTDPVNFNIEGYYSYSDNTDFTVSEDGQYLIMSAERDDSKGWRDLYVSHRLSEKKWSAPYNLKGINTEKDELAPFLLDGEYLFFSSDGYDGYGRSDIYVSRRLDNSWENWSEPVNLGTRINDEQDNIYFYYSKIRSTAYITEGYYEGNTDIFELDLHIEDLYQLFEDTEVCQSRGLFHHLEEIPAQSIPMSNCISLDASESQVGASDMKYMWYFGDLTIDYGVNVEHCYDTPGNYSITMTAIEEQTNKHFYNEFEAEVEILPALSVNINVPVETTLGVASTMMAEFTADSPSISDINYSWDFGDGNFSCGLYTEHTYQTKGAHTARVLVSFEHNGSPMSIMQEVTITVD